MICGVISGAPVSYFVVPLMENVGGLMGARKLHQGPTRARRVMGRKLVFQLPEVVNQFARDDHQQFA